MARQGTIKQETVPQWDMMPNDLELSCGGNAAVGSNSLLGYTAAIYSSK